MKIRIKFKKYGAMKFVGHLDMMRYFQRAIKRAGIDICYSEGYSPHQIMSFAAPLGVGITSDSEYFDIEVNSTENSARAIQKLNQTMVEGVEIVDYRQLPDKSKTAMSIITAASYDLFYKPEYASPFPTSEWRSKINQAFLEKDSFIITKKTKKSEKEVDLKPLVYDFRVDGEEDCPVFHLSVSTGSTDNIKPDLVLSSLYQSLGMEYDFKKIQIHRTEVYTGEPDAFVPLSDLGEVID